MRMRNDNMAKIAPKGQNDAKTPKCRTHYTLSRHVVDELISKCAVVAEIHRRPPTVKKRGQQIRLECAYLFAFCYYVFFTTRRYPSAVYAVGNRQLSVCLSVTRRYCAK